MENAEAQIREHVIGQVFGHLGGRLEFALLRLLHQGVDDVGLMPGPHFVADDAVDLPAAGIGANLRLHRGAARRELVDDRQGQVAEHGHGQGARDRGGGHHQDVRIFPLLAQEPPLEHAETVLLVHDAEPQPVELHLVLDHRVGTDHDLRFAPRHPLQRPGPGLPLQGRREERHGHPQLLAPAVDVQVVLLGQDLGGSHDGHLVAVLHRHQRSQERHQGLAAAHVPLHQPVHGVGRHHVGLDLGQDPALGLGQGKGKQLQERLGVRVVHGKRDSLLQGHPPPLERQAQFQEEEFVENQGPVGRVPPLLQGTGVGVGSRKVDRSQGLGQGQQRPLTDHPGRQGALHAGGEAVHDLLHDLAQRLLVQPLGERIDRHQPAESHRVPRHGRLHRLPLGQPVNVRMMYLPLETVLGHLAGEDSPPARLPGLAHERRMVVEPLEGHDTARIPRHHLEEAAPPLGGHHVGRYHFPREHAGLTGAEPVHGHHLAAVLVAVREQVEGILHGDDPLPRQDLGHLRPHPLDELHGGLKVLARNGLPEAPLSRRLPGRRPGQHQAPLCVRLHRHPVAGRKSEGPQQIGGDQERTVFRPLHHGHGGVLHNCCGERSGVPAPE